MKFKIKDLDNEFIVEVLNQCYVKDVLHYMCVIIPETYTYDNKPWYFEKSIEDSRKRILENFHDTIMGFIGSQVVIKFETDKFVVIKCDYCDLETSVVEIFEN